MTADTSRGSPDGTDGKPATPRPGATPPGKGAAGGSGGAAGAKPGAGRRALRFLPIVIAVAGLAAGYAAGLHHYLSLEALVEQRAALKGLVAQYPVAAAALFIGGYATAVALSFPAASILTIFAGFLFGWLIGGVLTAIAATTGATLIFLAARTAFGDVLRRKAGPSLARLADGFREDAFSYLFILRLAPVFPFFVVNIAPAFFDMPTRTYILATLFGILPGTFAYAYLGQGLDSVITAAAAAGHGVTLGDLVTPQLTAAFAALALVAAIPAVVKKLRARRKRA